MEISIEKDRLASQMIRDDSLMMFSVFPSPLDAKYVFLIIKFEIFLEPKLWTKLENWNPSLTSRKIWFEMGF